MSKRNFDRTGFESSCQISLDGQVWTGESENLSLKGVLVEFNTTHSFKIGQEVTFTLFLNNQEITLDFEATVAHCFDTKVGLTFTETDSETFTHLRRLLEWNLADAGEVTREIKELKSHHPQE
ncbi:PilZ domain-containing protein [Spirochaeta cellobiosiphila]|uniref:PilZ domain-containing protein n=1 Tax=Spirochaeta cellobiosiphila TaxID=504483 RepID=UPI0003F5F9D9|nr:PilZ domain-containing protein [Spirochaeta cellobiosiphila]